tara:strand:- start:7283 stop:8023 length:741 start_codon:yes stop_codon:yes gene_type:complete
MRGIIGNIRERHPNLIDMTVTKEAGILQYRVGASNSLNGAYGADNGVSGTGTTDYFEVASGAEYRSTTIKQNKPHVAHGAGRDRGLTRMIFDPDDFFDPAEEVPSDNQTMFMRVEKYSQALGAYEPKGPINIVLPKHFLQGVRPVLTLYGNAPAIASSAGEFPAEGAMHFHLPMFSSSIYIDNLSNTNELHVSFSPGMPTVVVRPESTYAMYDANVMEVLVSSDADSGGGEAAPAFNMSFGLQNGP